MGKLIRNGIEYGGGNGTDIFEVTQAEYDALKQAGTLVHNALYVISDGDNLNPTADDIEYQSGVTVADKLDDTYTKSEVDTLLGDKLDSEYLVKTNSGNFPALVKSNQVWLIAVQRVSLNTSLVLLCHNYNGTILVKEIVKDSGMAYITNNQGTVSITYGGSGESVRGGAYRLY